MKFDGYDLDPAIYDELFRSDGEPRPHGKDLHDTLLEASDDYVNAVGEWVTRSFTHEGITFTVYDDEEADERIIPIDCIPRVMAGSEWRILAQGLEQRLAALNAFLGNVYGSGPNRG